MGVLKVDYSSLSTPSTSEVNDGGCTLEWFVGHRFSWSQRDSGPEWRSVRTHEPSRQQEVSRRGPKEELNELRERT